MTPPRSILATVIGSPWVRDKWRRRLSVAVLALILAVLCLFPRHYMARAQLLPDDNGSGLSALLGSAGTGGLLSLSTLMGNHQSIESDLVIARSQVVIRDVTSRLIAEKRIKPADEARTEIKLRHKADIQAVRGSVLQVTLKDRDAQFAKAVVTDYVAAIRGRLAAITLQQTAQKKIIAADRMGKATMDLARSQTALDRFRASNRLASPEVELNASVVLRTELQARLHAQQAQLEILQQFATPNNIQVQAAQAAVATLRGQIATAEADANNGAGPSVGQLTPVISQYQNLFRDERYAEAEYEIYKRYLDTVTAEELSAGISMDVIEPPYISPERQFNTSAIGALALLIFLAVFAEFYIASPPVGAARVGHAAL